MSEFMKDIANISKTLPKKEPEKELDILSRSPEEVAEAFKKGDKVKEKDTGEVGVVSKVNHRNKKGDYLIDNGDGKVVRHEDELIKVKEDHDTPRNDLIESLESKIEQLEKTINTLVENQTESTKSKYPFKEGATATNPSTGEKIVFSKGEWWKLDAE